MDEDIQAVAAALRVAVRDSGLSQGAFAAALGTSAPRLSSYLTGRVAPAAPTYLRSLRLSAGLAATAAAGWLSAPATAAAVAKARAAGDEAWAFKLLLQGRDHLHQLLAERPEFAAGWEAAPRTTGSERWDLLLATLAAHEFTTASRPAPPWTARSALRESWVLPSPRLSPKEVRERTPSWLAGKGIYVNERDLVTL